MTEATETDKATGERMVWSIMDNAWVTLSYWRWVNGQGD